MVQMDLVAIIQRQHHHHIINLSLSSPLLLPCHGYFSFATKRVVVLSHKYVNANATILHYEEIMELHVGLRFLS
jgi:hypothetical protein